MVGRFSAVESKKALRLWALFLHVRAGIVLKASKDVLIKHKLILIQNQNLIQHKSYIE